MGTLITTVTDGQKKQYLRFVEDAAEKAMKEVGLDKDGIQKLIENGDEFQTRIIVAIQRVFSVQPVCRQGSQVELYVSQRLQSQRDYGAD